MDHQLEELRVEDGSWGDFEADWRNQCAAFQEEFEQYAVGSIPVLQSVAGEPRDDCGVFALKAEDGSFAAVAQVNSTNLPGYTEKVLRVRHLLMSPTHDFGDPSVEDYGKVLARMFTRTVNLAYSRMPSLHVKFHLRSPADQQFFYGVIDALKEFEIFTSVAMRGAWLYLSLKKPDLLTVGER